MVSKWPEQADYELIRTVVLFGQSAAERARQTGKPARTISQKTKQFIAEGMPGLLPKEPTKASLLWTNRLPERIKDFIITLKWEYPPLSDREIARICGYHFGKSPDHKTVAQVLRNKPVPFKVQRRFPTYAQMENKVEGRQAILTLYNEGWNVKSIAGYLGIVRKTVYAVLSDLRHHLNFG